MTQSIYSICSTEYGDLPIIDVTHPVFRVEIDNTQLTAMLQEFINGTEARDQVSPELRETLARSILGRSLAAASGSYLSGLSTYLMKLGPESLWANPQEVDRNIAGSFPALASRIRLQDMAQMLAAGLQQSIGAIPARPVCMVNIAGGTAVDSWNALICLLVKSPQSLSERTVRIAILDLDERSPAFGARAVQKLQERGAPLHGLNIELDPISYDWSEPKRLAVLLQKLGVKGAACAISSEGGLFEYGSDDEIVENLNALHAGTAGDTFVVGSVTRECQAVRANGRIVASRPRTVESFQTLVEAGGWRLSDVVERPFSYHVRLCKG